MSEGDRRHPQSACAKPKRTTSKSAGGYMPSKPHKIVVTQLARWSRDPVDSVKSALVKRNGHAKKRGKLPRRVMWGAVEVVDSVYTTSHRLRRSREERRAGAR